MSKSEVIPDSVETRVRVVDVLSERTARVRLPNGRVVFGYAGSQGAALLLTAGVDYLARLFVADFSRAELLAVADQSAKSI